MNSPTIQDQMGAHECFGCGSVNPHGLQIKSYWNGEEAVCHFTAAPHMIAGPKHVMYGGIVASIIDCHSINASVAYAYQRENRPIGSDPAIWCVTGYLHVDYKRPAPVGKPVELRARVVEPHEKKFKVACTVTADGEVCALGEVLSIRVPMEWLAAQ